jgi:hypothetical protein
MAEKELGSLKGYAEGNPELNTESSIDCNSAKYNAGTKQMQLIHEILNSAENWKPIVDRIKSGQARDISEEPKVTENKTCFIIGSGPSLDDAIEYLKDWKGGIICSTSHALTLMYHGIEPTHILVLDPFCCWSEIAGVDWSKTKTKLIAHPGCYPDIIANWPNEILLYLQNSGRVGSFYQDEQMKMYAWRDGDFRRSTFHFYIRTNITIFACSPPMQLFVGEMLGYDTFFLAGCDFAFHTDKDRFTEYTVKSSEIQYRQKETKENGEVVFSEPKRIIEWEKHEHKFDPNMEGLVKTNNGLWTKEIHLYYKKNFISAWRLCEKTVYTTDHGAITEIPYHDIKAVIKKQGDFPKQSKFFIEDTSERYLESVGLFIIETNMGKAFVESAKPEFELPMYMKETMRRYICNTCGSKMTSNPYVYRLKWKEKLEDKQEDFPGPDALLNKYTELKLNKNIIGTIDIIDVSELVHDGDECPACKNGKVNREVIVDIEANMKRIMSRMPKKTV